jgi:nicotinamide-nucleotide amidase
MTDNNLRQADVPAGATVIAQRLGTAPGLRCPVVVGGESRVIYALPGVPHEMQEMFTRGVLPELITQNGPDKAIVSRVLRACGVSESAVDEQLRPIVDELDRLVEGTSEPVPTIAYLASGIEGLKIRLSVKSVDGEAANRSLSMLEAQVRDVLGDSVFGVGDQTLEAVVGDMLVARGLTLGLAESLTAGLAGARCGDVVGASRWFRGSIVGYATDVKRSVLGVTAPLVVSSACAIEMAEGARRALSSHIGLSFTGVAGPDSQDGQAPGTVFIGLAIHGRPTESLQLSLPGDRASVRAYSVVSGFDWLRRRL